MSIEDEVVLYVLEAALHRVQGESFVNNLYTVYGLNHH